MAGSVAKADGLSNTLRVQKGQLAGEKVILVYNPKCFFKIIIDGSEGYLVVFAFPINVI